MYEGTLSLHCLSLSSVKAGSSDLIRGLIFNEGSQRRTRGRAATGLLICARWPSRRQTKNRGERLQLDSSGWREFVRFCRDGDVDSSVFSSVISKWTALQVSEPLLL